MNNNELAAVAKTRPAIFLGRRGIEITSMDELARFAVTVAESGLAPKGMDKPASIAIAVEMGLEIGLKPMQALQNIAVVNGRPCVWGDAMLGLCQSCEYFDHSAFSEKLTGTGDSQAATCTVRRLPNGQIVTRQFTVAQAKKAGLWSKQGPWSQYPERMLQMRARSLALRDTFPDVLRGMYSAEEVVDIKVETAKKTTRVEQIFDVEPVAFLTQTVTPPAPPIEDQPASEPEHEETDELSALHLEPIQTQEEEPEPKPIDAAALAGEYKAAAAACVTMKEINALVTKATNDQRLVDVGSACGVYVSEILIGRQSQLKQQKQRTMV